MEMETIFIPPSSVFVWCPTKGIRKGSGSAGWNFDQSIPPPTTKRLLTVRAMFSQTGVSLMRSFLLDGAEWNVVRFCAAILLCAILSTQASFAKEFSIGIHEEAKMIPAKIMESPSPQIPSSHQEDAFKSSCEARFLIAPSGQTTVTLITSSGSEEIDSIALKTLKRWKFKPATLEGKPVSSSRRIKVEFEVE
jgi:TonB family protein